MKMLVIFNPLSNYLLGLDLQGPVPRRLVWHSEILIGRGLSLFRSDEETGNVQSDKVSTFVLEVIRALRELISGPLDGELVGLLELSGKCLNSRTKKVFRGAKVLERLSAVTLA